MIDTKLIGLLPEEMSDETAYHLANLMINLADLALALANHYYTQLRRYSEVAENSEPVNF